MKTILCIFALLVLTASSADAYVRRAVGGGYVVRHPVARGAAVATGTAAVAAHPWGYDVYGPGGYYGPGHPVARGAAVAVGTAAVAAHPWGYGVYGPGGSYAPTAVQPVGPGWGVGAQPYQASVYGQGGPYADAPGRCYVDCANYYRNLRESGYDVKNYRTPAGTVKQTAY
jgi:hypothetical protein